MAKRIITPETPTELAPKGPKLKQPIMFVCPMELKCNVVVTVEKQEDHDAMLDSALEALDSMTVKELCDQATMQGMEPEYNPVGLALFEDAAEDDAEEREAQARQDRAALKRQEARVAAERAKKGSPPMRVKSDERGFATTRDDDDDPLEIEDDDSGLDGNPDDEE